MGPLASIRAFSDGYQGESAENSLMDMRRGNSHTCQCFAVSTEQNSELQANRKAQENLTYLPVF